MRKTTLAAVGAAALIATGFGVWATSPTNARVPSTGQGIDPHQMMMNARTTPSYSCIECFLSWSFALHASAQMTSPGPPSPGGRDPAYGM